MHNKTWSTIIVVTKNNVVHTEIDLEPCITAKLLMYPVVCENISLYHNCREVFILKIHELIKTIHVQIDLFIEK